MWRILQATLTVPCIVAAQRVAFPSALKGRWVAASYALPADEGAMQPAPIKEPNTVSNEAQLRAHGQTPARDEVLRRIGRNVVTFQQIEYLLKQLVANAQLAGPAGQISTIAKKQIEEVRNNTMGALAGKLVSSVLQTQVQHETPDDIDEAWACFKFCVGADFDVDAAFADQHDQEMRALVNARNDLVHHFLPRWHSVLDGDTDNAIAYLDGQHDDAVRMRKRLQAWATLLQAGRHQLTAFLASPEFELTWLQHSRLLVMLGDIAKRTARPDGWALLSAAGHHIKCEAPSELEALDTRFGLSNLKAVLLASALFDVAEERTPHGTRTLYRVSEQQPEGEAYP